MRRVLRCIPHARPLGAVRVLWRGVKRQAPLMGSHREEALPELHSGMLEDPDTDLAAFEVQMNAALEAMEMGHTAERELVQIEDALDVLAARVGAGAGAYGAREHGASEDVAQWTRDCNGFLDDVESLVRGGGANGAGSETLTLGHRRGKSRCHLSRLCGVSPSRAVSLCAATA